VLLGSIHSTLYWGSEHADCRLAGLLGAANNWPCWPASAPASEPGRLRRALAAAEEASQHEGWRGSPVVAAPDLKRTSAGPLPGAELAWAPGQRLSLCSRARAQADSAASLRPLRRLIALRQEAGPPSWHRWRQTADWPAAQLAGKSGPAVGDRDQQATLNHLFSPLRQRLPEADLRAMPALAPDPFPQPTLARCRQQSLCLELAAGLGVRCEERPGLARRPIRFPPPSAPAISASTQPGGSRQPFSAFRRQPTNGAIPSNEQGLPRQDNQMFAWPLGDATSMGVPREPEACSGNAGWRAASLRPRALQTSQIAQALTGSGSCSRPSTAPGLAETGGGR